MSQILQRVFVGDQQVGDLALCHGADVPGQVQCLGGKPGRGRQGLRGVRPWRINDWISAVVPREASLPNAILTPASRAARRLAAPSSMLRRASPASISVISGGCTEDFARVPVWKGAAAAETFLSGLLARVALPPEACR